VSVVRDRPTTADLNTPHAPLIPRRAPRLTSSRHGRRWLVGAALLVVHGCATSPVPQAIRDQAQPSPTVAEVQQRPESLLGQRVRWGGTILAVRNTSKTTEIEILGRPLDRNGKPDEGKAGLGRFIVELSGFEDPAELPKERRFTVVGPLTRVETRNIGDYPYLYPVVAGDVRHLWPNPPPASSMGPPFYDPWFHPWYGPWYGRWYDPWYRPWYGPW
jgi:outer membrane lipoprotein